MRYILDIESNGLLQDGIDYISLPYKLKDTYKVWCVVLRNIDSDEVKVFSGEELQKDNIKSYLSSATEIIGHNIIQFDLPILKLAGLLDYEIAFPGQQHTIFNKPVSISDTLLYSKLLNPDRLGGHSLSEWGNRLGEHKTYFDTFSEFSQELVDYCIQDTNVNKILYSKLSSELKNQNWSKAIEYETKLYDLGLKRELFGFDFNKDLALKLLDDLNHKMQAIADKVNPILPPKKMNNSEISFYTPPKNQIRKDGSITNNFLNFITRIDAKLNESEKTFVYEGQTYNIPYTQPLKFVLPSDLEDLNNLKKYLMDLGWNPSEWNERDLVKGTNKTVKNKDKIVATILRYTKDTRDSVYCVARCEKLGVGIDLLENYLLNKIDGNKPICVPTTPRLTIGLEKKICPNLETMEEKADFVADVCKYYTYRHRRNSIAGGEIDGEYTSGFLANLREDGRISTPADTLGANTGRYRHKLVVNIPRVTSLYGKEMRSLFGPGHKLYQLGFDYASLEARIQGHYCLPYTNGKELAKALVAEKPNDIHSINAQKLGIDRNSAKSFGYAALYGAQPKKLSKMLSVSQEHARDLYEEYWKTVPALAELKRKLEIHWEKNNRQYILGIDGRHVVTRSKHSLLNVLFQSGGAILAKYATVNIARLLSEANLLGNPLEHTEKEIKMWFITEVHDECQFAVHPSLLSVKNFDNDEEAEANQTIGSSPVGHGSKGAYVCYRTQVIDIIDKAIKEACKILNIRVEMAFEYMAGLNWAQCH